MNNSLSRLLPLSARSRVIVSERLGSFRLVVADADGKKKYLHYLNASGLKVDATHRCPREEPRKFGCIRSGIRALDLEPAADAVRLPPDRHDVIVMEETVGEGLGYVDLAFIETPVPKGGTIEHVSYWRIVEVESNCDEKQCRACATGKRVRRTIGVRTDGVVSTVPCG